MGLPMGLYPRANPCWSSQNPTQPKFQKVDPCAPLAVLGKGGWKEKGEVDGRGAENKTTVGSTYSMFDNGPDLTIEFKVCFVRYEILAYLSRIKWLQFLGPIEAFQMMIENRFDLINVDSYNSHLLDTNWRLLHTDYEFMTVCFDLGRMRRLRSLSLSF